MTLTIELTDETADRIRDVAAVRGQDLDAFAVATLIAAAENDDWTETQPDLEAVEGIRRGLAAVDAGDVMPLSAYLAEVAANRARRSWRSSKRENLPRTLVIAPVAAAKC